MNTEIIPAAVQHRGADIQVTASSSDEMAQSQTALIEWCGRKIATMEDEAKEMRAAAEHARQRKWKFATLVKHANLADRRVEFYRKLKAALEAGYIIVPSFPVEVFAVRTKRDAPKRYVRTNTSRWDQQTIECAETLKPGEGEYQNPVVRDVAVYEGATNKQNQTEYEHHGPTNWADLEFPLNMAKPTIMEATTRAMALKIFDDFGVLPGTRKNADPIIVARIRDPRVPHKWAPRMISFIIKWHLDTRTL